MNKISFLMFVLFLAFSVKANADLSTGMIPSKPVDNSIMKPIKAEMQAKKEEVKVQKEAKKEEIKKARFETQKFVKLNKEEQKKNLELFKTENKVEVKNTMKVLDKETKASINTLKDIKKAELNKIIEQIKSKDTSFEERQTFNKKLEELRATYYTELKTKLSSNSGALTLISEREAIFEKNKQLREESFFKRRELNDKIKEQVVTYRQAFVTKVSEKIETISADKLGKLIEQIEKVQAKNENNPRKETYIAQLEALKQIINDKIKSAEINEEMDLNDIVK